MQGNQIYSKHNIASSKTNREKQMPTKSNSLKTKV